MNQSRRGRGGKRAGNNPELAQVVKKQDRVSAVMCSPKDSSWSKMTPRSRTEAENRKVGNSAERDKESSLSSCWWVPNQIYLVLCGFSSKRLDDIKALRASVAWDIVQIAEGAPDAEQCFLGLNVIGVRMTCERPRCEKRANICSKQNIEKSSKNRSLG